jgi:N-acetyl sugar amidotransferase
MRDCIKIKDMKVCKRCLLDTTVSSITFNSVGICNYCEKHDSLAEYYDKYLTTEEDYIFKKVDEIKNKGKGKEYDCIVGLSGGTDSTYILLTAKKMGLRPLAVFFDNGWSSETSVSNIKNAIDKLQVDLITYVVDWVEFKDIQLSFLKASVPCIEVPTDIAISGVLYKIANERGIKYILNGMSFRTEGTVPLDWSFIDGTYVKNVQKQFGTHKFKSYPMFTIYDMAYYTFIKKIKMLPMLNYIEYDKLEARKVLESELNWKYYGGHHYENLYSAWAFGWYTNTKFNFDKRKVSLSGPIRTGTLTRENALKELAEKPNLPDDLTEYVIKKLEIDRTQFNQILENKNKSFRDYKTSYNVILKFKFLIKFFVDKGILSPVIYQKFF